MLNNTSLPRLSRRGLGAGAIAAAVIGSTGVRPAYAGSVVRMSVTDAGFPAKTLDSYKKGIAAMLALPPEDPANWYRQAIIHVLDCPHSNWWLLPWHRAYILRLESLIRKYSGDPDFALPYWDWTATPKVPDAFWDGVLNPADPAYVTDKKLFKTQFQPALDSLWASFNADQQGWMQKRGIKSSSDLMNQVVSQFPRANNTRTLTKANPDLTPTAQAAVSIDTINNQVLSPTSFTDFGSNTADNHDLMTGSDALESQPHNNVHNAISGFMAGFMSPVDPIFWLHHANVDRLWSVWTAAQTDPLPPGNAWPKEPFDFFFNAAGQPDPTTAGAQESTTALGYTYQTGSGTVPKSTTLVASQPPKVRAFSAARVNNAPLSLASNVDGTIALAGVPTSPTIAPASMSIQLTVTRPPNPNIGLLVFLNLPNASPSTPLTDPHFVGPIAFFGSDHPGMAHGPLKITLPIGHVVSRLRAAKLMSSDSITVQVVTVAETPSAPADVTPLMAEPMQHGLAMGGEGVLNSVKILVR